MTTDDATAARLREDVRLAAVRLYRERVAGDPDGVAGDLDAALDTLIRYHAARGAVEALEVVRGHIYSLHEDRSPTQG